MIGITLRRGGRTRQRADPPRGAAEPAQAPAPGAGRRMRAGSSIAVCTHREQYNRGKAPIFCVPLPQQCEAVGGTERKGCGTESVLTFPVQNRSDAPTYFVRVSI